MELKEIRKIKNRSKQVVMYRLVENDKITKYINDKNNVCYDLNEYKEYKKRVKKGRPPKRAKEN